MLPDLAEEISTAPEKHAQTGCCVPSPSQLGFLSLHRRAPVGASPPTQALRQEHGHYSLFYFWLRWAFVAVLRLSLIVMYTLLIAMASLVVECGLQGVRI